MVKSVIVLNPINDVLFSNSSPQKLLDLSAFRLVVHPVKKS